MVPKGYIVAVLPRARAARVGRAAPGFAGARVGAVLATLLYQEREGEKRGDSVSKNRALVPVLAGSGAAAVGVVVYALSNRRQKGAALAAEPEAAVSEPEAPAPLRESMVVPRAHVPDPLEVDLDLDGIFRGIDDLESEREEPTVRADVKVPALAGADDVEPPSADELGAYWLSRATQSERSLNEGDLEIDLDNVADLRDEAEPEDGEPEDEEQAFALVAGQRRD